MTAERNGGLLAMRIVLATAAALLVAWMGWVSSTLITVRAQGLTRAEFMEAVRDLKADIRESD